MMKKITSEKSTIQIPKLSELKTELSREKYKIEFIKTLINTLCILITVAGATVLVATFAFPVLHVCGNSMEPSLNPGEIVIAVKRPSFNTGDIIAFYHNNKILLKRVMANSGEKISINEDGTVYVDGHEILEPYITDKCLGEHDIEFPYQVPDGKIFVLGDQRSIALDSRSKELGCVPVEDVLGKIAVKIWPPNSWKLIL